MALGRATRGSRAKQLVIALVLAVLAATLTVISPTPATADPGDNPEVFIEDGTYTVPAGATAIKIVAIGGGGGSGVTIAAGPGGQGGNGSVTTAITNVTPGWALDVTIG